MSGCVTTEDLFEHAARYPHTPGAQDTDTSRAAAESMREDAPTLRARCLAVIGKYGPQTADEVAESLGETVLATRPRLTELRRLGKITDTGTRRANDSGRTAIVWRLAQ